MGENFSSYLTRYRLERAQELLQTTDLPVASVAVQTGYTTPDTFPGFTKSTKACPRRRSAGGQNRDKKIKIVTFPAPCGKRYHIRPKNGQAYGSTVFVFFVKLNL